MTRFAAALEAASGERFAEYRSLHRFSIERRDAFWSAVWEHCGIAARRRGSVVVAGADRMPGDPRGEAPPTRWFPEARLNFAENLLAGRGRPGSEIAIVFRGETGVRRELRWDELRGDVAALAGALRRRGIGAGDRVAALLPNLPETVVAMLATASLGAIFSSTSPDFGNAAVLDRFGQIEPRVLMVGDGYFYGGRWFETAARLPDLLAGLPSVELAVVVPYAGIGAAIASGGGACLLADLLAEAAPGGGAADPGFEPLPFDHPLYVMYSSGTTGKPKCIVHGAGGTLLQHVKEHRLHADVRPGDRLFYFTTCGWMMWNWLVSGLASGATLVLYDGSPFHPLPAALFDLAAAERISILGTSAKFLDAAAKAGLVPRRTHDLGALRTVLSTGSPLLPEGFDYVYHDLKEDVHLASISGGTDILSCFVLGNPTAPVWRGEIQCAGLGMAVEVFDQEGRRVVGAPGELVCTRPFPSMPLGFWGDPDGSRYRAAYFERFPGVWHHGDWTMESERGGFVIYGRSDAVLNPGGVRIGTAEIYRQVEKLDQVVEAIAVGQEWQGDVRVVLFVKLRDGVVLDDALERRIRKEIRENTSPRHVPARILQVADIPRTRSGKITELAVRDVVHGREVKNLGALANPEALEHFRDRPELGT
ncbi:MAG TPA: acetoacetate--CoA ligase [Thermoanaerobaculia bacterium]|nr:acetoacetate--CoA ligase [Thermoanaerobaculia bacterium]